MAPYTTITHADICAGVGGFGLALKLLYGERLHTLLFCEREAYAVSNLVARMEDQTLPPAVIWDDIASLDGRPWRGRIHILTAGFPCQPFSLAGKRKGTDDERWLWTDIVRVIREMGPRCVWLENVPGLALSNAIERDESGWFMASGLWHVLRDLALMGFNAEWGTVAASAVGASHRRRRIYILAHARGVASVSRPVQTRSRSTEGSPDQKDDRLRDGGNELGHAASDDQWRHTVREHGQGIETGGPSGDLAEPVSGRRSGRARQSERRPQERNASERSGEELDLSQSGGQPELRQSPARKRRRGHPDRPDQAVANATESRDRELSDRQRRREADNADGAGDQLDYSEYDGRSHNQSRIEAIEDSHRTDDGIPRAASGDVAEPSSARLEEPRPLGGDSGEELAAAERSGIPLFPPGPGLFMPGVIDDIRELFSTDPERAWGRYCAELRNTCRWYDLLQSDETLEPAIRRTSDGVSSELDKLILSARVDRIRAMGNAVVPVAAAAAFIVLAERLGVEL